jgi:membrane-bound lytic murein transglycosylase B
VRQLPVLCLVMFLAVRGEASDGRLRRPFGHDELVRKLSRVANPALVTKLLSDPRCRLDRTILRRPGTGGYSFLRDTARIARGREFLAAHRELLWRLYLDYGVEPEYQVAILAVETDYGRYLGTHSVLPALYTRYFTVRPKRRREYFENLASFIAVAVPEGVDPFDTPGSSAGAWGLTQLMARSYELYAVDRNGDGVRNLFDLEDALASAGNFLVAHGWGVSEAEKTHAFAAYNGRRYAEALMGYARSVRDGQTAAPLPEPLEPLPIDFIRNAPLR